MSGPRRLVPHENGNDATLAMKTGKKIEKKKFDVKDLPQYCDFTCAFASFAPADAVGACRREQAVYCTILREFNNKNARCAARK